MKKLLILVLLLSGLALEAKDISDKAFRDSFARNNIEIACALEFMSLYSSQVVCPFCASDDPWLEIEVDKFMDTCIIEGIEEGKR